MLTENFATKMQLTFWWILHVSLQIVYSLNKHADVILQQSYKQNMWRNAFWDSSDNISAQKQFAWCKLLKMQLLKYRKLSQNALVYSFIFAALLQNHVSVLIYMGKDLQIKLQKTQKVNCGFFTKFLVMMHCQYLRRLVQ